LSSSETSARSPWYHFAGLGGSGMSALAQFAALRGWRVGGSDRDFDRGGRAAIRAGLEALGIAIHPQDGSGVAAGCDALVVSTAVEDDVPDVAAARRLGVPVLHRSELLARFVAQQRTVAVTGTSGKSTVTAMVFEILRAAGLDPSVITGGDLLVLRDEGLQGNAWAGGGDLLVIEADESDGSLVRYAPWAGVLLNLQRDHKEPEEIAALFHAFRRHVRGPCVVADDANLDPFADGALRCGLDAAAGGRSEAPGAGEAVRASAVALERDGSRFTIAGRPMRLPTPGIHNVSNAAAAVAVCLALGVDAAAAASALAGFRGVARRFERVGSAGGVEVVDDFAHNPDKIAAAMAAARGRGGRLLAVFQPHGYGPTRFLRRGLVTAFREGLRPGDRLWLPEIYYAGGTVARDISSRDIVEEVAAGGRDANFLPEREEVLEAVAAAARPGDTVLVMGARDPSLGDFCRRLLARLAERGD